MKLICSWSFIFWQRFCGFRNSVLGKLSTKDEFYSCLNITWLNNCFFIVTSKSSSFGGDSLKKIMTERFHYRHGFLRYSEIWVNLLQNFVNEPFEGTGRRFNFFLRPSRNETSIFARLSDPSPSASRSARSIFCWSHFSILLFIFFLKIQILYECDNLSPNCRLWIDGTDALGAT